MEIRSALQKIENYLTVVSNLNKTILIEGTMSREELLLMKKYLYNSIDRIEDIEHKLIITQPEKLPTPNLEIKPELNTTVLPVQNEIISTPESENLDDVHANLSEENKLELENTIEEIKEDEIKELTEEVTTLSDTKKEEIISETIVETKELSTEINLIDAPTVEEENNKVQETHTQKTEQEIVNTQHQIIETPIVASITNTEENKLVANENEKVETIIAEKKELSFLEQLQSTIHQTVESLNDKFEEVKESALVDKLQEKVETITDKIEQKTTAFLEPELNENKDSDLFNTTNLVADENKKIETIIDKKKEPSFLEKLQEKFTAATLNDSFEKNNENTFADEILKDKSKESFADNSSFFEKLEEKEDTPKIVHLFDEEKKETVKESLFSQINSDNETINEKISFANDNYSSESLVDTIHKKTSKTISESIALNDKFIFVRELFGNQFNEYDHALRELEKMNTMADAEAYCKANLHSKFNWQDKTPTADRFNELLQKIFA